MLVSSRRSIAIRFNVDKLSDGVRSLMLRLPVSTQYRRVADGQTDGQIDRHIATAWFALCIRITLKKIRWIPYLNT